MNKMPAQMRNGLHVIVDLETFGLSNDAAIHEIGYVLVDLSNDNYIPATIRVNYMSQNRRIYADTVAWAMTRLSDEERASIASTKDRYSLKTALSMLNDAIHHNATVDQEVYLWGYGAVFDNALLASAYESVGLQQPWHYRNSHCLRTLVRFTDLPTKDFYADGAIHSALDDAKRQADMFVAIAKRYM